MGRRQREAPPPQPSPPPPDEELDIAAFSDLLRPKGLSIRDVANDGNCFFRAVSDQLYGCEDEHVNLRQLACDYLQQHADHYQHFIDEEQSFDEYVNEMRNDAVWADNLELQAISMACNVNIRVHQSGKPSYDIRNHPANNARAIHLSYHFAEHYASVRPLHTADLDGPAHHHPLPPPLPRPPSRNEPQQNEPPVEDNSSRTLRFRKKTQQHSVSSLWKRAERAHHDVSAIVEKARRAAKNVESSSRGAKDATSTAHAIDKDMKAARKRLETFAETIAFGRSAHRQRGRKNARESKLRLFTSGSASSENDSCSTQLDEGSDDEERYQSCVHRQTATICDALSAIERNALDALDKLEHLERGSKHSHAKHSKGSKRKEQDTRKKERKERRRRAQESVARGETENLCPANIPRLHELDIAI
ncbi:OTU domain-containing protein 3 [Gracilariopsis chorda]|uniref:OTU domain-containing protein 3 n=1 Tax=Gracilariopsis chorda TaxID=448386 RepID=A0A2V3J4U0_9FLOR|nr:OTU domain-containing protein 3 [Gracilariopsis chorda]|eukprot:PXF49446.1 OTU domain-containing protein 3 [Gracilariopsis chorda]